MRSWGTHLVTIIVLGMVLGSGASAADSFQGFGSDFRPWVRMLSIALNLIVVWVSAAFLSGRSTDTWPRSVVSGVLALYAAVMGYYIFGGLVGDRVNVGWDTLGRTGLRWLLVATLVGPLFGLIGHISRRRSAPGVVAALAPFATAVFEAFVILRVSIEGFEVDPLREWTITSVVVLALIVTVWSVWHNPAHSSA